MLRSLSRNVRYAAPLLLAALLACGPAAAGVAERDADLRRRLVGTWQNVDSAVSLEVRGETTYAADGSVSGWELVQALDPKGRPVRLRLQLKARWAIERGAIRISELRTTAPNVDLRTAPRRYEVLSITADELRFRDPANRSLLVRVRKLPEPRSGGRP